MCFSESVNLWSEIPSLNDMVIKCVKIRTPTKKTFLLHHWEVWMKWERALRIVRFYAAESQITIGQISIWSLINGWFFKNPFILLSILFCATNISTIVKSVSCHYIFFFWKSEKQGSFQCFFIQSYFNCWFFNKKS